MWYNSSTVAIYTSVKLNSTTCPITTNVVHVVLPPSATVMAFLGINGAPHRQCSCAS